MDNAIIFRRVLIARIHMARLEIPAIGDGANLAVSILARQPHFDVIGLARAKTEITCAKLYDAIWEFQFLQDRFGAAQHILMLILAIFGFADCHQFNFIELMLAYHPFGIFTRSPCFGTKTRCMGRHAFWECVSVEDAFADGIGQGDFCGWD